jgi:hypothetical protein
MSKENNDQIIELLKELVKWTKFQAWGKVKDVLLGVLDDNEKKRIYHLSDGKQSSRKIAENVSVSRSTIVKYWNDWANSNIVEPISVKGGGLRHKKMFNLEDFGIEIPKTI